MQQNAAFCVLLNLKKRPSPTAFSLSRVGMYAHAIWLWGCRLPLASLGRTRLPPLSLTLIEDVISSFWSSPSAFSSSVRDIRISDLVVVQMKTRHRSRRITLVYREHSVLSKFLHQYAQDIAFFPALLPHKLFTQVAPI